MSGCDEEFALRVDPSLPVRGAEAGQAIGTEGKRKKKQKKQNIKKNNKKNLAPPPQEKKNVAPFKKKKKKKNKKKKKKTKKNEPRATLHLTIVGDARQSRHVPANELSNCCLRRVVRAQGLSAPAATSS